MSNRYAYQFLYSLQPKLVMRNGSITFGASGAVASFTGPGMQGVTRLATGVYQIKLKDNFVACLGIIPEMESGPSGTSVAAGSFATGTQYQITALGTTTQAQWVAAGFDPDYTAAVGAVFVATAAGAGTGTAQAIIGSGIGTVEASSDYQMELKNLNPSLGRGASITVNTYAPTSSSVTTSILSNPASGSKMSFKIFFRDSTAPAV